jgi:N utilization substance protein B
MQALCQWDVQRDESPEGLREFMCVQEVPTEVADHASNLVQSYWAQRQSIDDRIAAAATNWDLSRISPVERNVMRVAIVELLVGEVPPKVVLDEAIEIGREYGGEQSPRFINGILDVVMKRMEKRRKGGG